MRAYLLHKGGAGIDGLVEVDRPMPKPLHRQVLVKVIACSLNYRDLGIVRGSYRQPIRENLVPLSDGAGEVVEVGPGVTRVKAGDKVVSCFFQRWPGGEPGPHVHASALGGGIDGMLTEYIALEEEGVVKIPGHLSIEEGATLPCAAVTAWEAMMNHAKLVAGQTVLLQGTGGVSIFGLQLAHMMGITAIITSSSDDKLKRAKALGAAHGINYKTTPEWDKAAIACNGGRGVDHVLEVGGANTLTPGLIFSTRANVQGISVGSMQTFETMNAAIAANQLKPVIDRAFGFDEVRAAYKYMESGAHFGKIVIRVA
jgi:NADPH:quinone reductase-like Zn-dependent oxidoreductase